MYQDDLCLAFHDIAPQAPTHVIVIPKKEIPSLAAARRRRRAAAGSSAGGHCAAGQSNCKLDSGYRVVVNCGPDAGQSVDHLHFHLLGGRQLELAAGLSLRSRRVYRCNLGK